MSRNIALIVIVLALLALAGGYMLMSKPDIGPKGTPMPGATLAPSADYEEVEAFVRHDLAKILTVDGRLGASERLEAIAPYVTPAGLQNVQASFLNADFMEGTERTDARFMTQPKVTAVDETGGQRRWTVACRVEIDFYGGGSKRTGLYDALITVAPKDLNGEKTFGVDNLSLTPAAAN